MKKTTAFCALAAVCATLIISPSWGAEVKDLIKVPVNGVDTYIYVQSSTPLDVLNQKPLLLVLHGGPGFAMMGALVRANPSLLDAFVVVDWDQRGAGHSYVESQNLDMKFDTFVADAHDVTTYLTDRYKRSKVYILGHSYGTMIGLMLVAQYPQLYGGFIAAGFAGDVVRNERGSRDWALNEAKRLGNATAIQELTAIGDPGPNANYPDYSNPVHGQTKNNLSGSAITSYWVGQLGGDVFGRTGADEIEQGILNSDIYKNIPWEEGWVYSQQVFEQSKLSDLDLWSRVKSVSAPVYFFQGVHDADTPYSLAKEFYNQLVVQGAGAKYWVDFENSAHFPFTEEPEKFSRQLISIIRSETNPAIGLSATSLSFDSTKVGSTSTKTLTITNTGAASLSITGIRITGTDSSQFKASPASGTADTAKTLAVTVTFAPTAAGQKSASLSIVHNATGSPASVSLSGVGVAATTTTVPDPAKQDSTKIGVWLDLNTAAGNQFVAAGTALPGAEVTVQVYGRNLTAASSYGVTLGYDTTMVTAVTAKFATGTYLSGAISLPAQAANGLATFGAALFGGTGPGGNGFLGTAVFKLSDKFTSGYTEIKVTKLTLGTPTITIQTSNAILKALSNTPPIARFTLKPDALKAGDTKDLVTLDASTSSDPDNDPITFKWTATTGTTFKKSTSDTSKIAQVSLADTTKSNVTFTLTVTDKNGAKTTTTQTLKILAPPSAASSVSLDLDPAADDQGANLHYGTVAGDLVTAQIFVKDLSGVTGYTVKVNFDSTRIESPTYANGLLIKGTFIPLTQYQTGAGVVQGGGSTLPATANAGSGLLATFTFKVKAGFAGSTTLSVTSINLQQGGAKNEMIKTPVDAVVTSDVPDKAANAAHFSDDPGPVGFDDFFLFVNHFNDHKGDKNYDARFDLNGDGTVDFQDFFLFAAAFGLLE